MTARLAVVLENPSAAEGLSSVGETNLAPVGPGDHVIGHPIQS